MELFVDLALRAKENGNPWPIKGLPSTLRLLHLNNQEQTDQIGSSDEEPIFLLIKK